MHANVKVLWEQNFNICNFNKSGLVIYAQKTIQSADINAAYMQQFNFTVLLLTNKLVLKFVSSIS